MPGGMVCSIATCKNNSKKAKQTGEKLMFFTFPKDPNIKKEWIIKCSRKGQWNPTNNRICSKHFQLADYEDKLQASLLNVQPKKLKKNAIPSLFLRCNEEENCENSEISVGMIQNENKAIVEDLISNCSKPTHSEIKKTTNKAVTDISETKLDDFKRKIEALEKENMLLKGKIKDYENNEQLLKQHISHLEEQIKKDNVGFEERVKLVFKDFLSSNQVEIALKKKSKARWTQSELSRAFTLRYFSKRSYIYLKDSLHYPLPALSTLQQWAANINLTNGVLQDVLGVMETAGKTKSSRFRATVLSFDEVKVSSLYEYYEKTDEIMGPYSYMQVVMARGLFDNWKQPVYIGFDQKMTKTVLQNVIVCLHEIKYCVVACTCDCGGGNQGLWKILGVTIDNTFTQHPITKDPIYFFADVPHLLKLLRNWFIDTGFILEGNTIINKNPVKALIENTRSEINSCHKLTQMHLNCEKTQRQNVKLAAQLFSNTTATALKYYLPGTDKTAAANTGNFFKLINNWFDVMNSYALSSSVPTKKPYGINLEMQNEILNEMLATISKMLCVGKKSLQIFQRGIIISIKSLQGLFASMEKDYDIKYLLTHRLNQDCLENLFCQIRTRGGLHDHPSPLNAIYRIRMILLGKTPGLVTTHSNVQIPSGLENEEYLLATALKQARLGSIKIVEPEFDNQVSNNRVDSSTTTSSSSCKSCSSITGETEKDGLIYIAGYLAKKHKQKYPNLGKYTYETSYETEATNFHNYSCFPTWIKNLSFGGLIEPSEEWAGHVAKMDKYFLKLHKDTFNEKKEIVKQTTNYIANKLEDVPKELVNSFCRQRIFVRIKFLNLKREETKVQKRQASEPLRKTVKKMKKIVN